MPNDNNNKDFEQSLFKTADKLRKNLDSYPELFIVGEIFSRLEESDELLASSLGQVSKEIFRLPSHTV